MGDSNEMSAWNKLMMNADPDLYDVGDERRNAAIACLYMSGANNGGLNAFLTNYSDLDGQEVLQSLEKIGANDAANQFRVILEALGQHLPAATEKERWDKLERLWTDELDEIDFLTAEADKSLVAALEAHVSNHIEYYLKFPATE
jgi:hypothetical protein